MKVLLLLLVGCASTRVAPGTTPQLKPGEGLMVVGAGDGVQVHVIRMNASPDWETEVIIPALTSNELAVMVVPANKYCITEIQTAHIEYLPSDPAQSRWCFVVEDQSISYVGHIEVKELQSIRFERVPAKTCDVLKTQYPDALRVAHADNSSLATCTVSE